MRTPLGCNYRNSYQERHLRGIKIWSNYSRTNDRQHYDCNCVQQWKTGEIVIDKEMYTISPFVPDTLRRSQSGRTSFGIRVGSIELDEILTASLIVNVFVSELQSLLMSIQSNKNHVLTKKKYNRQLPAELITFGFR